MPSLARQLLSQPPLDAERERRLARAARGGDHEARDALIRESLRLVALRAHHLGLRGDALDEAVQSGTLGLIRAVDRFDPDRGCRLATYAWSWITAAIRASTPPGPRAAFREVSDEAPVPVDDLAPALALLPSRLASVIRLRYGLDGSSGSPRTRSAVAAMLGLTVAQVRADEARAMTHLRSRLARVGGRAPREGADPL